MADDGTLLRITAEELAGAAVPPPPTTRTSHLAVGALVLGLLGLPLVGFLLGPLAIGCGVLALSAINGRSGLTGTGLAVAGLALGSLDTVGWLVGLAILVARPAPVAAPLAPAHVARAVAGVADAPPAIRRALRANVLLRCRGGEGEATGAGVVVARAGTTLYALTNRHVIACGSRASLTVATLGGAALEARVCWSAPEGVDLALVEVSSAGDGEAAAVPVRSADLPRIGDAVFAVGNPLGYEASYTAGVLSAIRDVGEGAGGVRVLQVQAGINPGNSGGGLYDAEGRLVGLNTWRADRALAEGIGFAIAVRDAVKLLERADAPCARAARERLTSAGGGPR
jgi:S1-C subfamily serine protease